MGLDPPDAGGFREDRQRLICRRVRGRVTAQQHVTAIDCQLSPALPLGSQPRFGVGEQVLLQVLSFQHHRRKERQDGKRQVREPAKRPEWTGDCIHSGSIPHLLG